MLPGAGGLPNPREGAVVLPNPREEAGDPHSVQEEVRDHAEVRDEGEGGHGPMAVHRGEGHMGHRPAVGLLEYETK